MNEMNIDTSQHLTFVLGKEIFAISIGSVREVLELTKITKIPRTPDYMRGVINLRGHAVPVVDMRRKFGMAPAETTVDTCIIIVEVDGGEDRVVIGGLVDAVREVFEIPAEAMEPPPRMGAAVKVDYIRGMTRQDEEFVIILDIDKVFSAEELAAAVQAADGMSEDARAA